MGVKQYQHSRSCMRCGVRASRDNGVCCTCWRQDLEWKNAILVVAHARGDTVRDEERVELGEEQ